MDLRCRWNDYHHRVEFSWNHLIALGYENLSISIFNKNNESLLLIICDSYQSEWICSSGEYIFEPGEDYRTVGKLKKYLSNYEAQINDSCSFQTSISNCLKIHRQIKKLVIHNIIFRSSKSISVFNSS